MAYVLLVTQGVRAENLPCGTYERDALHIGRVVSPHAQDVNGSSTFGTWGSKPRTTIANHFLFVLANCLT